MTKITSEEIERLALVFSSMWADSIEFYDIARFHIRKLQEQREKYEKLVEVAEKIEAMLAELNFTPGLSILSPVLSDLKDKPNEPL